ncbi:hypothetical protein NDU88_004567 [Pleurodeles waltl]|uniref:Uncharacterized protein n=1 Tax=Pleurodeles waltl TaxID=8319 RepID=A0AAV7LM42_PLEWA|nr:hypothetical protein NDU88_004567 [Pleurodeles waltl]
MCRSSTGSLTTGTIDETVHANARRRHNAEAISFHTAFKMCRSSTGSLTTGVSTNVGRCLELRTPIDK